MDGLSRFHFLRLWLCWARFRRVTLPPCRVRLASGCGLGRAFGLATLATDFGQIVSSFLVHTVVRLGLFPDFAKQVNNRLVFDLFNVG